MPGHFEPTNSLTKHILEGQAMRAVLPRKNIF